NCGLQLQSGLSEPRAALLVAGHMVLQCDSNQPRDARARRCVGREARVQEHDRYAVSVVDERRIPGDALTALDGGERLGECAEVPGLDPALLERRPGPGKRELCGFAELCAKAA